MTTAVAPLRNALLDQAQAEAERVLAEADEQAAATLAEADSQGTALVEEARAAGIAAGSIEGAHEEVHARRFARALVLSAQRELYDELRRQSRAAVHELRHDPRYPELLERLSAAARAQLGDGAALELDPPDAGGVRGSKESRHVDYTLDALVERCLDHRGARPERLWA